MADLIEASVMFQTADVWKMYAGIVIFLFGLAALNYFSACSKKDPIE